jgi:hypothetical protein
LFIVSDRGRRFGFAGVKVFAVGTGRLAYAFGGLGVTMVTAEMARRMLALHGELRPQASADWSGTFAIPPAVERFYCEVGPFDVTIQAHGNPYFLPCLSELWMFQAGYRWNGLSGEPIEVWNEDWLVVADEGGDPFILERSSGVVLHAYQGEGLWDPTKMFPDLNTMAACLAQLGAIVLELGDEYTEEDCAIRPAFKALAATRFQELLGSKSDAETILGILGWG